MRAVRRREFLISSAVVAGTANKGWTQSPDPAKLDRIAIMTLCFSSIIKSAAHKDEPARTLDILDAPQMIAERYGVHWVEVQHAHFPSTESSYLKEFRGRLAKAKSRINQICLEFGPLNISSPDAALRVQTINLTKKWIDYAVELGCPRIMVNQGTMDAEVRQTAIATFKTICEYGKSQNVAVTMENRGRSAPWYVVVEVIKEVLLSASFRLPGIRRTVWTGNRGGSSRSDHRRSGQDALRRDISS
jgi:Xylose isomerase-like TIM barrel